MSGRIITTLIFLCSCSITVAQKYRVSFVRDCNPWLTTDNAATLTLLDASNTSEAQLTYQRECGGFCDYRSPQAMQTLSADVESYYHILPRLSGYGRISYHNTSQHLVAGSAFLNSHHMPFDIVEDSLANEGDAHKDTYNIAGALSYDIGKMLSIGAMIDFTAADYAKYKDLRHKNSLTDITTTIGLFSPITSWLQIGSNIFYRRNIDGVSFSLYGSEEKVYHSLIDYGILTGEVETFGENGYTERNTEQPFVSEQGGVSIQLGCSNSDKTLSLINEFSYRQRSGYYGRDTEYSIVHNRHKGNIYKASSVFCHRGQTCIHQLLFSFETEDLQTDAMTYITIQDEKTSAHYYQYLTPVKMSNKLWTNYSFGYRSCIGMQDSIPTWTSEIRFVRDSREQTVYFFPYSRHQQLWAGNISASLLRNIPVGKHLLSVSGFFAYRWGHGDNCTEGFLASPSDKQREPDVMLIYQQRDYHSFIVPQYTAEISARYAIPIPSAGMTGYAHAAFHYSHANGSMLSEWFNGKERKSLRLTIGAYF